MLAGQRSGKVRRELNTRFAGVAVLIGIVQAIFVDNALEGKLARPIEALRIGIPRALIVERTLS